MGSEAGGGYDFDFLGVGGGDEYEGRVAEWEAGLPDCDELTPLSQPLVPPGLAAAFRIPPEPGRTLLDVHRASSATVSRLRSSGSGSSGSGPNANNNGSFPSFSSKGGNEQDPSNTNNSAESAGEKAGAAKRARLVWTPQLHRRFVDVVAHLGIKAAVPKTIMQLMNVEGLTRENVASHLQKYRLYVTRQHGRSDEPGVSQSESDHVFASAPVPRSLREPPPPPPQVPAPMPMPPAVYHHPAPMTMGGMTGGYYQHHSGHAVYNGYGGGHGYGMSSYPQYHHGDR